MAQDPDKPKDDGKIRMPKIDLGMNKLPPKLSAKAKKRRKRRRLKDVRDTSSPPALSENTDDNIEEQNDEAEDAAAEKDAATGKDAKVEKPKSNDEDDDEILARMRKRLSRAIAYESTNRKDELEDLKFKAGDQWDSAIERQRTEDGRPCMKFNKMPWFVHQITNDLRQNRPAIQVSPVGSKGDPKAAKIFQGMIRAIERDCSADIAYDTASDSAVSIGEGYFRLTTERESPKSFDQIAVIKRIRNRFTVYLDPAAQEPDGADSRWGFVTELVPRDQFEAEFPDFDPMPYPEQGVGEGYKDWIAKDEVRVAEYFELTQGTKTLIELDNGWTGYKDELADQAKDWLKSERLRIVREREVQVPKWKWYKASAKDILERTDWLGQWIPIIRVIGDEIDIEGKVKYSGVIRNAKDAQRAKNYAGTAQMETVALQPKAPYIVAEGQIEGHEGQWAQANRVNYPYLSYKPESVSGTLVPPPQRQPPPSPSQGWDVLRAQADQDLMATTGVRADPTMSEKRVDDSGKALRELRRSTDIGSFHYVDNLSRAMKNLGRQLIDLIPKIYDGRRIMTIIREDDTEEMIRLDPDAPKAYDEVQDPKTGKTIKILNPSLGMYACTVTTGPSYATKRIEAAESMMSFLEAVPTEAPKIADLIVKHMDWEGSEEIYQRLVKGLPPNLLTPEQKDIPPQAQAVMRNLETQVAQLTAQLKQAVAELASKEKDRGVAMAKIEADFETKLFAVMQKADAQFQQHIGRHVQELGKHVAGLQQSISAASQQRTAQQ